MIFSTRLRSLQPRLLAMAMVFAGLASGCQSSRPGFSFQPAPGRERPVLAAVLVAVEKPVVADNEPLIAVEQPRFRVRAHKQLRQLRTPVPAVAAAPVLAGIATSEAVPHRRVLLQRPQATAEMGLGTTVLGVLGLIMLPIALVGLLLSGGPVWGIVAVVAALAVLVAYLDPFGR